MYLPTGRQAVPTLGGAGKRKLKNREGVRRESQGVFFPLPLRVTPYK
jgi:hypothetical protein